MQSKVTKRTEAQLCFCPIARAVNFCATQSRWPPCHFVNALKWPTAIESGEAKSIACVGRACLEDRKRTINSAVIAVSGRSHSQVRPEFKLARSTEIEMQCGWYDFLAQFNVCISITNYPTEATLRLAKWSFSSGILDRPMYFLIQVITNSSLSLRQGCLASARTGGRRANV